ncbi:uncharacterized protein BDR25DRAFT_356578 [Lindgomyces ingoldianus]|uniref:Uncharacterized protein n=1 Tax=Lindgomyces ingoldianus TaxID=673940 RepID=A0ACB6QQT4_9PLEO|nr:uncharacterized protein BDR25DRAFT_356578 [Lindgomyces ingoldianus]KAF2469348.1 hypothetical protein BDR25DRAFT_356578 [Lindgomyces ingoldianus]
MSTQSIFINVLFPFPTQILAFASFFPDHTTISLSDKYSDPGSSAFASFRIFVYEISSLKQKTLFLSGASYCCF